MPTDTSPLAAIVFDATEPWLAARTLRALARRGVHGAVATREDLVDRVAEARGPVWLVRAGAWPYASPSRVLAGGSGRSVVALGATTESHAWRDVLAKTGGDFAHAHPLTWPRVDSAVVLDPRAFASLVAETGTVEHAAVAAASSCARVVRVPSLDVGFQRCLRIVLAVTTLHRGGAERVVLDLARELRAAGHDVLLTVLDRAVRSTFDEPPGTIHLHEHARGRMERIDVLASLAAERGADVIHAHLLDGEQMQRLSEGDVPVVVTVHNSQPGWPAGFARGLSGARAPLLVACSRDVARELRAAGLGATRTIWNGVAPTVQVADSMTRSAARAALGLTGEGPVILAMANHRPQKRLERLPTLLAAVRARGIDAKLVVVGEPVRSDPGSLAVADRIGSEAERLGVGAHVILSGSRGDTRTAYAASDVVVSASAYEGLSLVHLETVAAGLPLVTTRVAGVPELAAKHEGVHAVDVEATPEVFAAHVEDALRAVPKGREGLAPDFSTKRMAERHVELFARVSSRRAGAAEAARLLSSGIVLVTNNFSTGGAQSSARRLLTTLAAEGVAVHAVVIEEQAAWPTPARRALEAAGVPVFVAPRAGHVDPLVTARAVAARVDAVGPRAVLFWNVIPEHKVLIADLLLDVPVWDVSPGEMYFASFRRYFRRPRVASPYLDARDYGALLEGAIVKYGSERERAAAELGVRVEVVPNGVVVPESPARRRFVAGRPVVVGTLARIAPDKKLDQLVDAVAHAHATGALPAGLEVHIAGTAERGSESYADELRARGAGLPIVWAGERDSAEFLAGLDLFAMVSEPSGCPNASLEAMAVGLPIVATNAGGASEQLAHGETGLLVPRGDTEALGEAIAELALDSPRRENMGDAAHRRAKERFDVRRMAADYARICLGVALSP